MSPAPRASKDATTQARLAEPKPHPAQIVVFCDGCGTEAVHDYLVTDEDGQKARFAIARAHLRRAAGWRCDETGDHCPECQARLARAAADEPAARAQDGPGEPHSPEGDAGGGDGGDRGAQAISAIRAELVELRNRVTFDDEMGATARVAYTLAIDVVDRIARGES